MSNIGRTLLKYNSLYNLEDMSKSLVSIRDGSHPGVEYGIDVGLDFRCGCGHKVGIHYSYTRRCSKCKECERAYRKDFEDTIEGL